MREYGNTVDCKVRVETVLFNGIPTEESVQDKLVGPDHVLSYSRAMDMVWILTLVLVSKNNRLLGPKKVRLHAKC